MSRLTPLPPREIVRRLQRLRFDGPFPGRKHRHMRKGTLLIRVPNPHGEDVSVGLIAEILRVAGISREDWTAAG